MLLRDVILLHCGGSVPLAVPPGMVLRKEERTTSLTSPVHILESLQLPVLFLPIQMITQGAVHPGSQGD